MPLDNVEMRREQVNGVSHDRKEWSARETALLKALVESEVPQSVMAERLDRSVDAIKSRLRCLGLQKTRAAHSWTPERIALAKRLLKQGCSFSQIATELGGVTRNAVIGKLHRMGLRSPAKPSIRAKVNVEKIKTPLPKVKRSSTNGTKRMQKRRKPLPTPPEPLAKHIPLEDLNDSVCRWPIGSTPPFTFCGCKTAEGSSYCEHHKQRAESQHAPARAWAKGTESFLKRFAA